MNRSELADRLISVFFPQRCLICGEVVAYDDFWCGECVKKDKLSFLKKGRVDCDFPQSFADGVTATLYGGDARGLIWRVKDKADKRVLRFFADEMCAVMSEYWGDIVFDVIVPVPTTVSRMKERGFNPAELLARAVGAGREAEYKAIVRAKENACRGKRREGCVKLQAASICSDALVRLEDTRPQRGLTAAERRENAQKSYAAGESGNLKGKRVLLVDDVFTTGSTADACAQKLIEMGVDSVYVVTASSTNPDDSLQKACNHSESMV